MANSVFDMMNESDPDMNVTGGAITSSEYEQNMSPDDQRKYEKTLMNEFMSFYKVDPYKRNLSFKNWLKTLSPELIRERSKKFDDVKEGPNGYSALMDREDGRLLEDASSLQKLAHLHTGRVEDLIEIVSTLDPQETAFQQAEYRRP